MASCGTIGYTVSRDAIELLYQVGDDDGSQEVRVTVPIRRVRWRFGGQRRYWTCPNCWRHCEVVVMASRGRYWGCRQCLRLRYRSQALAPADRLERRAAKLYAKAGLEDDAGMIYKHKWMRWRTFNRLMDRANALADGADALHFSGVCRILARLAPTRLSRVL